MSLLLSACLAFTPEQNHLINMAQQLGNSLVVDTTVAEVVPDNVGNVLAAIVWQESFLGDRVVRFNPRDGRLGSYGVAHMQVTTASYILGDNDREAIVVDLLTDDLFAMQLAHTYLLRHVGNLGLEAGIARYNGSGQAARNYARAVLNKAKTLDDCFVQDWS